MAWKRRLKSTLSYNVYMTDMTEKKKKDPMDEFISLILKGSDALRKRLKIGYSTYRFIHEPNSPDPKDHYLFGVLNEIEKATMALMQTNEFINDSRKTEPSEPSEKDDEQQRIYDNVIQSKVDELSMWQRKMTELIVELQSFATTNTQDYYRHFLSINHLQQIHRTQDDLLEYYNAKNENYKFQEDELIQQIDQIAERLDPRKVWCVKVKDGQIKRQPSTFEERFRWAFKRMKPPLRALLRTGNLSYGVQSKNIHASSSADVRDVSLNTVEAHAGRVATLAIHVVVMAKDLMHIHNVKGALRICAAVVKKNDYPLKLHQRRTRLDAHVGDYVAVNGHLAQVIKVNISQEYRYKSFRIRYLVDQPLPSTPEDEVPGDWVRVLYRRSELLLNTMQQIKKMSPGSNPSVRQLNQFLKDGVIEAWNNGLKEYVLNRPDEGKAKLGACQHAIFRVAEQSPIFCSTLGRFGIGLVFFKIFGFAQLVF